jgi:AbrB family looped-hinge helix DNA binding protein
MTTTIDKAGRVVIPAAVREKAGFEPGAVLQVTYDDHGIRLERVAAGPTLVRSGKRLVAKPQARGPVVDVAALVQEERDRWP